MKHEWEHQHLTPNGQYQEGERPSFLTRRFHNPRTNANDNETDLGTEFLQEQGQAKDHNGRLKGL